MEQRKARRFDLKLPFELIRSGSEPLSQHGETKNLSSAGVLFQSEADLHIGEPVEYVITLPTSPGEGERVRLHSSAKWCDSREKPKSPPRWNVTNSSDRRWSPCLRAGLPCDRWSHVDARPCIACGCAPVYRVWMRVRGWHVAAGSHVPVDGMWPRGLECTRGVACGRGLACTRGSLVAPECGPRM